MKEIIRRWLGIDRKDKDTREDFEDVRKRLRILEEEIGNSYSSSVPGGIKEHLWALMKYLDVMPHTEILDDPSRRITHPTINRIVVDKRKNTKYQFVDKSSNATPAPSTREKI